MENGGAAEGGEGGDGGEEKRGDVQLLAAMHGEHTDRSESDAKRTVKEEETKTHEMVEENKKKKKEREDNNEVLFEQELETMMEEEEDGKGALALAELLHVSSGRKVHMLFCVRFIREFIEPDIDGARAEDDLMYFEEEDFFTGLVKVGAKAFRQTAARIYKSLRGGEKPAGGGMTDGGGADLKARVPWPAGFEGKMINAIEWEKYKGAILHACDEDRTGALRKLVDEIIGMVSKDDIRSPEWEELMERVEAFRGHAVSRGLYHAMTLGDRGMPAVVLNMADSLVRSSMDGLGLVTWLARKLTPLQEVENRQLRFSLYYMAPCRAQDIWVVCDHMRQLVEQCEMRVGEIGMEQPLQDVQLKDMFVYSFMEPHANTSAGQHLQRLLQEAQGTGARPSFRECLEVVMDTCLAGGMGQQNQELPRGGPPNMDASKFTLVVNKHKKAYHAGAAPPAAPAPVGPAPVQPVQPVQPVPPPRAVGEPGPGGPRDNAAWRAARDAAIKAVGGTKHAPCLGFAVNGRCDGGGEGSCRYGHAAEGFQPGVGLDERWLVVWPHCNKASCRDWKNCKHRHGDGSAQLKHHQTDEFRRSRGSHGPRRPPAPEQAHAAKLAEVQKELAASKAAEKAAAAQLKEKQAELDRLTVEAEAGGELQQVMAELDRRQTDG